MTVAANPPFVEYLEDGVTTGFPVPFRFKQPQNLVATRIFADGLIDVLAYGSEYSASGGATDAGGTLTVAAAAVSGTRLRIRRVTPRTQAMNYAVGDTFPAESHEGALDHVTLVTQELDVAVGDLDTRALKVPEGESAATIDAAGVRANKFQAYDPFGAPISSAGTGADLGLRQDLGAFDRTRSAALLGYNAPGAGSIDERVLDMLDKAVWLDSKGADRNGVGLSLTPYLRALETGRPIVHQSGIYNVGEANAGGNLISLADYGEGVAFLTMGEVEVRCTTTADVVTGIFALGGAGNSGFRCEKMRFRDMGYDPLKTWRGAIGFNLIGGFAEWGDLQFDGIYGKDLVSVMTISGAHATNRIRGINIDLLYSDNCYYGLNAQNQGDGLTIGQMVASQNYRPYFVYGVTDHYAKIFNRNNRATSGAVNIARFDAAYPTTAIEVDYTARAMSVDITHVLIDHLDTLGGEISNVDVNLDIRSSVNYDPARFVNYTGLGGSETAAASLNECSNIRLRGTCDAQARDVSAVAAYANKGFLDFVRGKNFRPAQSVFDAFSLSMNGRGNAMTWLSAGGGPPVPGSGGFCTYNWEDIGGGMLKIKGSLNIGTGPTLGTGIYTFRIPGLVAKVDGIGPAYAFDSGTGHRAGVCLITAGGGDIQIFNDGVNQPWGATTPITWAAGDRIRFEVNVEVS